jgi:hypothetical protein
MRLFELVRPQSNGRSAPFEPALDAPRFFLWFQLRNIEWRANSKIKCKFTFQEQKLVPKRWIFECYLSGADLGFGREN